MGINYAPETTGIAPYTTVMATRLAARGHAVRVITAFPHYPEWRFRDGRPPRRRSETIDGVQVERVRHPLPASTSGVSRLTSEVAFGLRLVLSRWGRPDVIVLVSPPLFASAIAMLRAKVLAPRTPVGLWVQDVYTLGMQETDTGDRLGLALRLVRAVERRAMRAADGMAVIHERFTGVVDQLSGRTARTVVVRNWTHVHPALTDGRDAMRRRLGWNADETIVLHTGNMGVKQHLENVIAAARAADGTEAPVRFVLMGDGGERGALERSSTDVLRLQFARSRTSAEYMGVLRAADVLLVNEHPGLREMAMPSKLTSYFASARPIVAATHADSITAAELDAARAGIRVDPGDPEAMVAAVLRLRDDRPLGDRLGEQGRAYGEATFSEDAAVDAFERWLVALRRPRRVHQTATRAAT